MKIEANYDMKKIEAIIRTEKQEKVVERLKAIGVKGMTISQAIGWSRERPVELHFRGTRIEVDLLPKLKFEIVVSDEETERVVQAILESARTGEVGDGIVFIQNLDEVVNINTGKKNEKP